MVAVLVLADDDFVGTVLHACLSEGGHTTYPVGSMQELLQEVRGSGAQAVVVEAPAPALESESLCRRLAAVNAPPLMLAISDGAFDASAEAALLRAGADDVIWSPFHPDVFVARLEVLVRRRVLERHRGTARPLIHDGIVVDLVGRRVWVADTEVALTRVEFDLMATLAASPHRVHSRLELAYAARIRNAGACLDPHLSRLRRKIREAGGPRVAVSVHRTGFRLTASASPVYT
jgi:DNA-binding response OmpR family regulator